MVATHAVNAHSMFRQLMLFLLFALIAIEINTCITKDNDSGFTRGVFYIASNITKTSINLAVSIASQNPFSNHS